MESYKLTFTTIYDVRELIIPQKLRYFCDFLNNIETIFRNIIYRYKLVYPNALDTYYISICIYVHMVVRRQLSRCNSFI